MAKKQKSRKRTPDAQLIVDADKIETPAAAIASCDEKFKIRLPTSPSLTFNFTIVELDRTIRLLLKHRAGFAKGKSQPAPIGVRVEGLRRPTIVVNRDGMLDETIFHVQHPGLGWFSFTLSEEQVTGVLRVLADHQSQRKAAKPKPVSN